MNKMINLIIIKILNPLDNFAQEKLLDRHNSLNNKNKSINTMRVSSKNLMIIIKII